MVELNEKSLEAAKIARAIAMNMLNEGTQWRLDPRYILILCNAVEGSSLPAPDDGLVERQIRALLLSFVAEHFPENTGWRPLPNLLGMVSQLDNAITIARDYRAQIEQLTRERDEWRGHVQKQNENVAHNLCRADAAEQQVQKLIAENERLREALRRIIGTASKTGGHGTGKWHNVCLDIARSALETQDDQK